MSGITEPESSFLHAFPAAVESHWEARLSAIVKTMKAMSQVTDPQEMVRIYGQRVQELMPVDRRISLSRRGLKYPYYRVTRYNKWATDINPWKEEARLPVHAGGLLAELIYGDTPRILTSFELDKDDPANAYLDQQHSLLAIPLYDEGVALNMVIVSREVCDGFLHDELPERVWMSNLFGRATQNLVLAERLETAYHEIDRELQAVADMQRSLLPAQLPEIPGWQLAAHYQTSKRAGGDYYDFFPLANGAWGMLVADVSGHGTPAAVMMAITHCIAHLRPEEHPLPQQFLEYLNQHLTARYTLISGHFITAFYAIYHPDTRMLCYSSAGHNPPRLRRGTDQSIIPLDQANALPLGIMADVEYRCSEISLNPGDRLVLYTDGVTEATNAAYELFGSERLDAALARCTGDPRCGLAEILGAVELFTGGEPPNDDRTLIVADLNEVR